MHHKTPVWSTAYSHTELRFFISIKTLLSNAVFDHKLILCLYASRTLITSLPV